MTLRIAALWLLMAGLWVGLAHAQHAELPAHLTVADGLPSNETTSILQDSRGYIWVGSWTGGASRFDGLAFRHFVPDPNDEESISTTDVQSIFEDIHGRVWFGGRESADRYDPRTETIRRFVNRSQAGSLFEGTYFATIRGSVWLGIRKGIFRLDEQADSLVLIRDNDLAPRDSMHFSRIHGLFEDPKGDVWLATSPIIDFGRFVQFERLGSDGRFETQKVIDTAPSSGAVWMDRSGVFWLSDGSSVIRFDPESGVSKVEMTPRDGYGGPPIIVDWLEDSRGRLWGASLDGLRRIDPTTGASTVVPLNESGGYEGDVPALTSDAYGRVWVGSPWGLHVLDEGTSEYRQVYPTVGNFRELMVDREGTVWGASTQGVIRVSELRSRIRYFPTPWLSGNLTGRRLRMTEDKAGRIWLAGYPGIHRLDPRSGQWDMVLGPQDLRTSLAPFLVNPDSTVSYAGSEGRLFRIDPESGGHRTYSSVRGPFDMELAADGAVWVAGLGVARVDPSADSVAYIPITRDGETLERYFAGNVQADPDGTVWSVSGGHLQVYEPTLGRFVGRDLNASGSTDRYPTTGVGRVSDEIWVRYHPNVGVSRHADGDTTYYTATPGDPTSLSDNEITGIYLDETGTAWVGTGNGLNRFDKATGSFTRYTSQNSNLGSARIEPLVEDSAGRIWTRTAIGLSRFDPARGRFDHIRSPGVSEALLLQDGGLAFATAESMGIVESGWEPHRVAPLVSLETVTTLGKHPQRHVLAGVEEVRLPYSERDFAVEYVALHFQSPAANRYQYRLRGYQEDWNQVGSSRRATFTNLPPGAYHFDLRAAGEGDVWTDRPASVAITIHRPWWLTRWSFALYVLLAIGVLAAGLRAHRVRLYWRLETEAAKERADQLEELSQFRSRFLGNVSHDLRTPLTLTLGPLEDVLSRYAEDLPSEVVEDLSLAGRSARRLKRLTDQLLELARLESGQLELEITVADLGPYLRDIAGMFASLAARRSLKFETRLPEGPVYAAFDPSELEKVFINLIANAFKYTPDGGTIRLTLSTDEVNVEIRVVNSGPGIPSEMLPHIFDRFYRLPGGEKPGAGIGLSLVRELVAQHGGTVEAESEEGISTTFTVRLPAATSATTGATLVISEGAASLARDLSWESDDEAGQGYEIDHSQAKDRPSILVVDDDRDMRSYVRRRLGEEYWIMEAADGFEALNTARHFLPDLVVSDVVMPRMDGFALCSALKSDPVLSYVPVILLTGRSGLDERISGLEHGADRYLSKPFDERELRLSVRNLLERHRELSRHFSARPYELHATKADLVSVDATFLEKVRDTIESNISRSDFGVEELAQTVGQSRSTLYRHVRRLLDTTPSSLIRRIRLERARQMLEAKAGGIGDIAYSVGFESVSYFAKCFREEYEITPSAFAKDAE